MDAWIHFDNIIFLLYSICTFFTIKNMNLHNIFTCRYLYVYNFYQIEFLIYNGKFLFSVC